MVDSCLSLPQNLEAEIGVLGCLLVEDSIVGDIIQNLDKSFFSYPAHQLIFEAVTCLFEQSKPIDPVSIQEELKKNGAFRKNRRRAISARPDGSDIFCRQRQLLC